MGILDGICRQKLIKEGRVFEAYLTKDDLKKASHIYACNSVRGVYEITLNKIAKLLLEIVSIDFPCAIIEVLL